MRERLILSLFVVFACLSAAALADDATTNATVTNSAPVASSVLLNGGNSITLTSMTTTEIIGTADIYDANGCSEITSVTAKLYRTGAGSGGIDDNRNHYSIACTSNGDCAGGGDLVESYTCTFDMYWYADPTDAGSANEGDDWTLEVTPYDAEEGTPDTDIVELNTLTSMILDATSIDFGELGLGEDTGATNQDSPIINTGNEALDIELSGYGAAPLDGLSMVCTTGTVLVGNIEYSTMAFSYSAGTDLSDSAAEVDIDLDRGSDAMQLPETLLYYGLGFPASGIAGTCSGTLVVTAVSDPNID
jgi:hypothetical protein